jgi:hypothetical protein
VLLSLAAKVHMSFLKDKIEVGISNWLNLEIHISRDMIPFVTGSHDLQRDASSVKVLS